MREDPGEMQWTDHVDQNIRVIRRLNEINKVVYLSKLKYNMEAQEKCLTRARHDALLKMRRGKANLTKWDEFRERRLVAIDAYLKVKRRQKALQELVRMLFLHRIIKTSFRTIGATKAYRAWCIQLAFLSLKLLVRFKMRTKKYRGLNYKHKAYLRSFFTFIAMLSDPTGGLIRGPRAPKSVKGTTPVPEAAISQAPGSAEADNRDGKEEVKPDQKPAAKTPGKESKKEAPSGSQTPSVAEIVVLGIIPAGNIHRRAQLLIENQLRKEHIFNGYIGKQRALFDNINFICR